MEGCLRDTDESLRGLFGASEGSERAALAKKSPCEICGSPSFHAVTGFYPGANASGLYLVIVCVVRMV